MKTLTIIQARTGSARLPGKALAEIGDRSILEHVIARTRSANLDGELIVATSARAADNPIADLCVMVGVDCYRSSERDVLNRFYRAAVHNELADDDVIVRVTADCPLLCPVLLDATVTLMQSLSGLDYAGVKGAPNGLGQEAVRFGALKQAWEEATMPDDREHVITFVEDNPDRFGLAYVEADDWMRERSHWRLTVDDLEDLELLQRLYGMTDGRLFELGSREIVDAVAADEALTALASRQP